MSVLPKSGIPDEQVDELCRRAYALAINASHNGARVEIHLSKALADRIRARATMPETIQQTLMFGFPAERHDNWVETRVEIHAITTVR